MSLIGILNATERIEDASDDIRSAITTMGGTAPSSHGLEEFSADILAIPQSGTNVQADWAQTDTSAPDYIKNKPNLSGFVTDGELETTLGGYVEKDGSKVLSDNNFSDEYRLNLQDLNSGLGLINASSTDDFADYFEDFGAQSNRAFIWTGATGDTYTYTDFGGAEQTVTFHNGDLFNISFDATRFGFTLRGNINGNNPVDQTYDEESTNAQSGIAVAQAIANKADKGTTVKDTTSTSVTLTANGNYSYIYGTLTSLNLSFATGTDDAAFHVIYKSGATATTMTVSATNAIFDSFAPSANAIVEIDGRWYLDKWVVIFHETVVAV